MITDLQFYIYFTFFVATIYSLVLFYFASNKNTKFIIGVILWGTLHSLLAYVGFYENTRTIPPRFILSIFPIVVIVISSIFSSKMKDWLASFNFKQLMFLHAVRVPVELVLFWLFLAGYVPELMTFEGRNFDILAGITAPIMVLIAFRSNKINKTLLWVWHVLSIVLLANILVNAILSMPTVLQQFAFDQPNVAVTKFPFLLLPVIIVPLVLISNIAGFIKLRRLQ